MPDATVTAEPAITPRLAKVGRVADNFVALVRSFNRAKARLLANASQDVEWAAHVLLRTLELEGPMRASALAEHTQADASTVSRHVAGLVKDGLLERRADPGDGRASLLVPTVAGRALVAAQNRVRLEYFADLMSDWSDADLRTFAAMLERFNSAYDNSNDEWIRGRLAHGVRESGEPTP